MSAQAIFIRADTVLQAEMAQAVIALVAVIEAEGGVNGIYRLKLEGETITASVERFYRSRQFHRRTSAVLE